MTPRLPNFPNPERPRLPRVVGRWLARATLAALFIGVTLGMLLTEVYVEGSLFWLHDGSTVSLALYAGTIALVVVSVPLAGLALVYGIAWLVRSAR